MLLRARRTALHVAVEAQDLRLAEALLAAGADVNAPNQDIVSCCHHAASR